MGSGVTVSSNTTLNGDVTFNGASTGATFGAGAITLNGNRNFTVADATAATGLTVLRALSATAAPQAAVLRSLVRVHSDCRGEHLHRHDDS